METALTVLVWLAIVIVATPFILTLLFSLSLLVWIWRKL